jgi:hypothetical protein
MSIFLETKIIIVLKILDWYLGCPEYIWYMHAGTETTVIAWLDNCHAHMLCEKTLNVAFRLSICVTNGYLDMYYVFK